jgi:AcrR family transcriptional regulator
VARWEPGTAQRLQQAALELFATRGFEQTTAAEIAQSVGLTERTFFRHFADKREALFFGQEQFVRAFLDGVAAAPAGATPIEIVASALRSAASFFPDERRVHSRTRQAVIEQNPALRERELHKLASLATVLADALRRRGVDQLAATLAAQTGTSVFGIAFGTWIADGEQRSLADIATEVLGELRALTAPAEPVRPAPGRSRRRGTAG